MYPGVRQIFTFVPGILTSDSWSGLDHDVQNKTESNLKKYEQIEAFGKKHGVPFFPAGYAIAHQLMVDTATVSRADCYSLTLCQIEELFVWPGTLCVASDSHSNMYGGISSLVRPPYLFPSPF